MAQLALFWHPARASCAAAKEFLGEHEVSFESLNVRGDGEQHWIAMGRPIVPSLVVDGRVVPILHVSQIANVLGLPAPAHGDASRLAVDTVDLLRAWIELVRGLSLQELCAPTPARGRSLRNLTVNVAHPFELLPEAWATGVFPWRPEDDELRERELQIAEQVVSYAERRYERWSAFVSELGAELDRSSRRVSSPRGEIGWPDLVDQQRWHVAFHYRQLVAVLDDCGLVHSSPLPLELLEGSSFPSRASSSSRRKHACDRLPLRHGTAIRAARIAPRITAPCSLVRDERVLRIARRWAQ